MIDREKREKERQEVFEATWRSYRTAIQNALTLQEQTLEFAPRTLLESPAETLQAQSESNRATLDGLAEQSGRQRATLENLIRESANVYLNLIQAGPLLLLPGDLGGYDGFLGKPRRQAQEAGRATYRSRTTTR